MRSPCGRKKRALCIVLIWALLSSPFAYAQATEEWRQTPQANPPEGFAKRIARELIEFFKDPEDPWMWTAVGIGFALFYLKRTTSGLIGDEARRRRILSRKLDDDLRILKGQHLDIEAETYKSQMRTLLDLTDETLKELQDYLERFNERFSKQFHMIEELKFKNPDEVISFVNQHLKHNEPTHKPILSYFHNHWLPELLKLKRNELILAQMIAERQSQFVRIAWAALPSNATAALREIEVFGDESETSRPPGTWKTDFRNTTLDTRALRNEVRLNEKRIKDSCLGVLPRLSGGGRVTTKMKKALAKIKHPEEAHLVGKLRRDALGLVASGGGTAGIFFGHKYFTGEDPEQQADRERYERDQMMRDSFILGAQINDPWVQNKLRPFFDVAHDVLNSHKDELVANFDVSLLESEKGNHDIGAMAKKQLTRSRIQIAINLAMVEAMTTPVKLNLGTVLHYFKTENKDEQVMVLKPFLKNFYRQLLSHLFDEIGELSPYQVEDLIDKRLRDSLIRNTIQALHNAPIEVPDNFIPTGPTRKTNTDANKTSSGKIPDTSDQAVSSVPPDANADANQLAATIANKPITTQSGERVLESMKGGMMNAVPTRPRKIKLPEQ